MPVKKAHNYVHPVDVLTGCTTPARARMFFASVSRVVSAAIWAQIAPAIFKARDISCIVLKIRDTLFPAVPHTLVGLRVPDCDWTCLFRVSD